ncbi:MAG: discoidin domain-containing protein [Planctomycetes bacterium]|nr:discoidin domain-containing protein [Planctomycetota bacterium]
MRERVGIACVVALAAANASAQLRQDLGIVHSERWKSGVPLGGIGCGKLEILTDGSLGNFTGNHNWDRPTGWLRGGFFAVQTRWAGKRAAKLLRLASGDEFEGVSNVAETDFSGWFPMATVRYTDKELPIRVTLDAFSPLIPHDVDSSSLPVAIFSVTLQNTSTWEVQTSVLVSWPNLLGFGGRGGHPLDSTKGNRQEVFNDKPLSGLQFVTAQNYDDDRQNTVGEYVLAALGDSSTTTTSYPMWDAAAPTIPFWSDFVERGTLDPARELVVSPHQPAGAIAATTRILPGRERTVRFVLAWHLPTHRTGKREEVPTGKFTAYSNDVAKAIDGDPDTRWSTDRPMMTGDSFTVDFGEGTTKSPTHLTLECVKSPNDFPRGYRVEGSTDLSTWATLAEADEQATRAAIQNDRLSVSLPGSPVRAIRIVQLGRDAHYWWSIHELRLEDSGGAIALRAESLSAERPETEEHATWSDQGNYYASRFTSAAAIARYATTERERLFRDTRDWQSLLEASNLPQWLKQKLVNDAFTLFSNTVLTKDGRFSVLESPIDMGGALGTMDQRMAAHAIYTDLFPELDRTELEMYAAAQQDDGRITHFVGNVHETVGDPDVGYGITDWPDLSCSWILQVLKLYRWTGDHAFLDRMWPHTKRAVAFLEKADQDGDAIPEGGSTYDYEQLPRGAFVYSASCTLGALEAAAEIARVQGEGATAKAWTDRFALVQKSTMDRLWNGKFFVKWRRAKDGEEPNVNANSFVASLAGDWLARLAGLPRTLPADVIDSEVRELIARHLKPFYPVPPMEVTPEGKLATTSCFLLQHEPYLGCEAINEGYVDDGIDVLRRVYDVSWPINRSPWDQSLCYDAPCGAQGGLVTYMTCPASWHVLNALSGATIDLEAGTLYLAPRLPSALTELHLPLFFSSFWATLDFIPDKHWLALRVTRTFGGEAGGERALRRVARDADSPSIALAEPFILEVGNTLDLSKWIESIAPPSSTKSKRVDACVSAKATRGRGLPCDAWSATASACDVRLPAVMVTPLAFDGQELTRWSLGRALKGGDRFDLDLGRVSAIAGVALDFRNEREEFPRGVTIEVSADGRAWERVAALSEADATEQAKSGELKITFAAKAARHVRLTSTAGHSEKGWSIDEIYVTPAAPLSGN